LFCELFRFLILPPVSLLDINSREYPAYLFP
jgi:hypothetical protein